MNEAIFLPLTLIAAVSPLLTFATLWQIKEWRMDRLREHLRAEGHLRQLFGIARPAILAAFLLIAPVFHEQISIFNSQLSILSVLILFAGLSVLQFLLHKQPKPVWTAKAYAMVGVSLLLTGIATVLMRDPILLPLIPLLQPFFLLIASLILCPMDRVLKRKIMRRAREIRSRYPDLTVIGITGSVGKTTTKELLAHLIADHNVLVTPAHVNTEMGVSQWLINNLSTPETEPEILIVEMGAYRKGEIDLLCKIVQPTMGIITFIGTQHIALFGSQEALCKAKSELIHSLSENDHAFLNADSTLCGKLAEETEASVTTVGTGGHADLEAFDIDETLEGIRFTVGETAFMMPLRGTHNISNVLLAIAVAEALGMPRDAVAAKLRTFSPPKKTFEVREESGVTILDDTHNASPESFRAAILWAKSQPMEHKILLTSGLIEQGVSQDRIHAELGKLAANVFDDVICLNKRSATTFARGYGKKVSTLSKKTQPIAKDSLLVCVGRMSPATIKQLLS